MSSLLVVGCLWWWCASDEDGNDNVDVGHSVHIALHAPDPGTQWYITKNTEDEDDDDDEDEYDDDDVVGRVNIAFHELHVEAL